MTIKKTVLIALIAGLCGNWAGAMEYEEKNTSKNETEKKETKDHPLGFYLINETDYTLKTSTTTHYSNAPSYEWSGFYGTPPKTKECGPPLKPETVSFIEYNENLRQFLNIAVEKLGEWNHWFSNWGKPCKNPTLLIKKADPDYVGGFIGKNDIPSLQHLCASTLKNLNMDTNIENLQDFMLPKNISLQKEEQNDE